MRVPNDLHNSTAETADSDGHFCWFSGPGVAALSVLMLDAVQPKSLFGGALANVDNRPRRVWLSDAAGNPIDEVMACREARGILLTCHGGPGVRRAIEAELCQAGLVPSTIDAFGRGAFAARTLALLPQAQGTGGAAIVLEAARQLDALRRACADPDAVPGLLADSAACRYLFDPPRVQLWGPVNAGKSSLLNALSGGEFAGVGDEPGLTRDLIEARFEHEGFVIRVFDAPGVWAGGGKLDAEAQQLAETWRAQADLTVHLEPGQIGGADSDSQWVIFSRADERPDGAGVSIREPATLAALKDRLVAHFFGPLQSLPPERRFALHPGLREDLAAGAGRDWLD